MRMQNNHGQALVEAASNRHGKNSALLLDHLAQTALFAELSTPELEHIAQTTEVVSLARGEMLFQRHDPCCGFYIVVFGKIKLYFSTPQGQEKVARLIGGGDSFGEAMMFLDKPYILNAQALDDSLLLHVSKDCLYGMIEQDSRLARRMLASLSQRLNARMSDIQSYSLQTGAQRVVAYLMNNIASSDQREFRLEASKTVIASRLNITPEHFSRILRELSERNLIEVNGRNITLLDLDALAAY